MYTNNLSFWEKESLIQYDYIIAGAGITGLSTACELLEKNAQLRVLVLDAGVLPTGASTKNAGFACIGSLSEKWTDAQLMGKEALIQLVKDRYHGLQILRKRLGDDAIQYENQGGYELVLKSMDSSFLHHLEEVNQWFRNWIDADIFSIDRDAAKRFGFNTHEVETCVYNRLEGQLHTGAMFHALWNYAQKLGVRIITGARAEQIEETPGKVWVHTQSCSFEAQKVFVCTNAFTRQLFEDIELQPGRGQVLVTKPIAGLKPKGIFFFDEGYYYFKNQGSRIVFGGGRNLDFETENTLSFGSNTKILDNLNYYLQNLILPGIPYETEMQWSGIMAFSRDKLPLVKAHSERVFLGVRLNGMGVALGSKIARDLVKLSEQY